MSRKNPSHILAAMALLAVFAVGMLLCLVTGAKSYGRISRTGDRAYTRRTAAAYLHTQISRAESVRIEPFGEGTALCLREELEGHRYITRIYCHEGWLMELFALEGEEFAPEDGRRVMALEALNAQWEGQMLVVHFTDTAGQQRLQWMRSEGYEE